MILHTSLRLHWIHDQGFNISVELQCSEILLLKILSTIDHRQ